MWDLTLLDKVLVGSLMLGEAIGHRQMFLDALSHACGTRCSHREPSVRYLESAQNRHRVLVLLTWSEAGLSYVVPNGSILYHIKICHCWDGWVFIHQL